MLMHLGQPSACHGLSHHWGTIQGKAPFSVSSCSQNARVFRVLRLLRAGRLLISVPELYILLSGLTTSIKAIFFGSIMLIFVVFVWAIVTW